MKEAQSLISKIHEKGNRFITEQLNASGTEGLVPSHGDILAVLYFNGKSTMKDIADKIHRTRPTVTVLLKTQVISLVSIIIPTYPARGLPSGSGYTHEMRNQDWREVLAALKLNCIHV